MAAEPETRGGDRRAAIVAAAVGVAEERGVGALTVRGVASRAGCGVGTLRHYFPTQRELIDAVLPRLLDRRLHDEDLADDGRPRDVRLAALVLQFLPPAEGADGERMLSVWFEHMSSALSAGAAPGSTQLLEALAARAHERVRRWLRELTPERANDTVWVDDTADHLVSLCSGLCLEALTPGSPVTLARARNLVRQATARVFAARSEEVSP